MLQSRVDEMTSEMPQPSDQPQAPAQRDGATAWLRWLPIVLLVAGFAVALNYGVDSDRLFDLLRTHRATLTQWVANSAVLAGLVYMVLYAVVIAFSIPGGAMMTIVGGFLFGQWLATALVVVAATIGATLLFLAAKTSLGAAIHARAGPFVRKMERGFAENAVSYLLVLRLVPIFPFWVVNLVPALLGIRLSTYVIATAVGIIPGTFVFATVGAGLGSILESGEDFSLAGVLTTEIVTALVGLAVLALIPVIYRKIRARRAAQSD